MLFYTYVLILSLIVIGIISWIEFYALISKIFKKKNYKDISSRFLCKTISLLYLSGYPFEQSTMHKLIIIDLFNYIY